MGDKTLKDLSKEEIGELFPIEVTAYKRNWSELYENEKNLIVSSVDANLFLSIAHFGSTSIPGMQAKDTIDILMEVEFEESNNKKLIEQMNNLGYEFNWQNEGLNTHMVFVKGYDVYHPKSQTYHIHAGPKTHPIWDRLLFKDYLIKYPDVAEAYAKLKLSFADQFRHDRVGYRIAKSDFVNEITQKGKIEFH